MHAITEPPEPFLAHDGALRVHAVPAASDNIVWIAECTATGACAFVDGPSAKEALAYCEQHGLQPTALWNTHTHIDHVGINSDLQGRGLLDGMQVVGPARAAAEVPGISHPVDDGDTVSLGALMGTVWLTEGHIDGHISFVVGDVLFCGDTLFAGGCGYLFDGPPAKMFRSLMRLAGLPGETRVCCAHEYTQDNLRFALSVEPDNAALQERMRRVWALRAAGRATVPSTIEEERATNPFLRPGSPTLLAQVAAQAPGADLSTPERTFAATRRLKDTGAYKAVDDGALVL